MAVEDLAVARVADVGFAFDAVAEPEAALFAFALALVRVPCAGGEGKKGGGGNEAAALVQCILLHPRMHTHARTHVRSAPFL